MARGISEQGWESGVAYQLQKTKRYVDEHSRPLTDSEIADAWNDNAQY